MSLLPSRNILPPHVCSCQNQPHRLSMLQTMTTLMVEAGVVVVVVGLALTSSLPPPSAEVVLPVRILSPFKLGSKILLEHSRPGPRRLTAVVILLVASNPPALVVLTCSHSRNTVSCRLLAVSWALLLMLEAYLVHLRPTKYC
jgi:hypothetical protein